MPLKENFHTLGATDSRYYDYTYNIWGLDCHSWEVSESIFTENNDINFSGGV